MRCAASVARDLGAAAGRRDLGTVARRVVAAGAAGAGRHGRRAAVVIVLVGHAIAGRRCGILRCVHVGVDGGEVVAMRYM